MLDIEVGSRLSLDSSSPFGPLRYRNIQTYKLLLIPKCMLDIHPLHSKMSEALGQFHRSLFLVTLLSVVCTIICMLGRNVAALCLQSVSLSYWCRDWFTKQISATTVCSLEACSQQALFIHVRQMVRCLCLKQERLRGISLAGVGKNLVSVRHHRYQW